MSGWPDLVGVALLGTARRRPAPVAAPDPALAPVLDLLPWVQDAERALLDAAAVLAVARTAARRPDASGGAPPPPAPDEERPPIPRGAMNALDRVLGLEDDELLAGLLARASAAGFVVAPERLPALLDRDVPRALLDAAGGARLGWLRALRGEAPAVDLRAWRTGDRAERVELLEEVRFCDPAAGRELVESTWDEDGPQDRAAFVAVLGLGLSDADEPLLERALADRRKPVRAAAVALLAQRPRSAYAARMRDRLTPLLADDGRLLALPPDPDARGKRDGLELKPRDGMGARSALLQTIVAATPLDVWPRDPAEHLAEARESEHARALVAGWIDAATFQHDARWAAALTSVGVRVVPLLELLGPDALDRLADDMLLDGDALRRLRTLAALPGPWPPDFSLQVADALRRDAPELTSQLRLGGLLRPLATRIDPGAAPELHRSLLRLVHAGGAIAYAAQDAQDRLDLRLAIDRELPLP